jgi:hypothetical protein
VHFALNCPIYRDTYYLLIDLTMLLVVGVPSDWYLPNYHEDLQETYILDIKDFKA